MQFMRSGTARAALQVKVVPTTPARLHRPLGEVLATPEPQVIQIQQSVVPQCSLLGSAWLAIPTLKALASPEPH